jgi:hypothetical protein
MLAFSEVLPRIRERVERDLSRNDRRLGRIVQRCQALPGEDLFQYVDDEGVRQTIGSGDVNDLPRRDHAEDPAEWNEGGSQGRPAPGRGGGSPASPTPACHRGVTLGSHPNCVSPSRFRRPPSR